MKARLIEIAKDIVLVLIFLGSLAAAVPVNGLLCFVIYTPAILAAFKFFKRHGLIY